MEYVDMYPLPYAHPSNVHPKKCTSKKCSSLAEHTGEPIAEIPFLAIASGEDVGVGNCQGRIRSSTMRRHSLLPQVGVSLLCFDGKVELVFSEFEAQVPCWTVKF